MNFALYTVYDTVAMEAGPIFQARNDAVAVRAFKRMMTEDHVNDADYRLYCVGEFDTDDLVVTSIPSKEVFSPGSEADRQVAELVGKGG